MKKSFAVTLLALALAALFAVSCKKEENTNTDTAATDTSMTTATDTASTGSTITMSTSGTSYWNHGDLDHGHNQDAVTSRMALELLFTGWGRVSHRTTPPFAGF